MNGLCSGAWIVNRLENRSNANGRNNLDNDNGRLLGITHLFPGLLFFHFFFDLILAITHAISSYVIDLSCNLFLISRNLSFLRYIFLIIAWILLCGRISHTESCLCSIKLAKCPQTVASFIPSLTEISFILRPFL